MDTHRTLPLEDAARMVDESFIVLYPTERELQVIYRALKVYEYEDLMYNGVGAVPVDEEEKERETVLSLLSILEAMGVKA